MDDSGDSTGLALARDADNEDPEPPRRLTLDVVNEDGDWSAFGEVDTLLADAADALARRLQLQNLEAVVALSSDASVQALNRDYRHKDKPTNVLSFPAGPGHVPPGHARHIGDIALAAETIVREAAEQDKSPQDHLQHLVVHGLLHLLGYDHETEHQAVEMEALEVEILGALGVADPYAGLA
jgi:probable rRNA maturation factor